MKIQGLGPALFSQPPPPCLQECRNGRALPHWGFPLPAGDRTCMSGCLAHLLHLQKPGEDFRWMWFLSLISSCKHDSEWQEAKLALLKAEKAGMVPPASTLVGAAPLLQSKLGGGRWGYGLSGAMRWQGGEGIAQAERSLPHSKAAPAGLKTPGLACNPVLATQLPEPCRLAMEVSLLMATVRTFSSHSSFGAHMVVPGHYGARQRCNKGGA